MSDYEARIWARVAAQDERAAAELAQQAEAAEAAIKKEQEEEARLERALKAGQEAVALLVKYNAQKRPIWEQRVVGKKPYQGSTKSGSYTGYHDVVHYFKTGQAWHVYSLPLYDPDSGHASSSHAALTTEGRAIFFEREVGYATIPRHEKSERSNRAPVEGIVHPRYLPGDHTMNLLESDEFQDGIASIIKGSGPLRSGP